MNYQTFPSWNLLFRRRAVAYVEKLTLLSIHNNIRENVITNKTYKHMQLYKVYRY